MNNAQQIQNKIREHVTKWDAEYQSNMTSIGSELWVHILIPLLMDFPKLSETQFP